MTVTPALPLRTPRLVMFDLDYTLLLPSDQFEAPGYRRTGARFGLDLDPALWLQAERAAYVAVEARRLQTGLSHDDGLIEVIARAVIEGLGGGAPAAVTATMEAIMAAWSEVTNFGLYEDVLPCLQRLRNAGVRVALVSNAVGHGLEDIVAQFALGDYVETTLSSSDIGLVKPAPQVFHTVLERLGVEPGAAVMVGDDVEADVKGALACGCAAILLDRGGRYDLPLPTIRSLAELPAALSLEDA